MNTVPSSHPNDLILNDYGLGKLDDQSTEAVKEHLEACADCRRRVSEVAPDSFLGRLVDVQKAKEKPTPDSKPDEWTISAGPARGASPQFTETLPPGLINNPNFQIKRELGRGGMGVVYLAHNEIMGRDEVLKVMGRPFMERPGVFERFQREVKAVAQLRHPNIVTAYTAFRIDGGLAFAMEYVEGLDLSKVVKAKGPLPIAHAAYFTYQVALGLQHAYVKGTVHRDIKPHNLMLTLEGKAKVIKILDFGLAKATREEKLDKGLTAEGQALGTPDYIAPEQILNAPEVNIRADIYSLGATLFYLLSGRPPFQANSLYDLFQAHISRDADPLNLIRPEVSAELAALVAKMMAKNPDHRFQTPGEVAEAIKPFFRKEVARPAASQSQAAHRPQVPAPIVETIPDSPWGSLILDPDPEEALNLVPRPMTSGRMSRRKSLWVATGSGVFGLLLLGIIVVIEKGRVTIAMDDGKKSRMVGVDPNSTKEIPGEKSSPEKPNTVEPIAKKPVASAPETTIPPDESTGKTPVSGSVSPVGPPKNPSEVLANQDPPLLPEKKSLVEDRPDGSGPEPVVGELLQNAGCEEKSFGQGIASWTSLSGEWTIGSREFSPFEGRSYFYPGKVGYAELIQDVDVGQYETQIDRKKQAFRFNARVRSYRQPEPGTSQVVIEFLDKNKNKAPNPFAFPQIASVEGWHPLTAVLVPPLHTRFIRISLRSRRTNGESNDGVFDGLSLKAIPPAPAATAKRPKPADNDPIQCTSHSFVLKGNWRIEGDELVQTERNVYGKILLGDASLREFKMKFNVLFTDGKRGPHMCAIFHHRPTVNPSPMDSFYLYEVKDNGAPHLYFNNQGNGMFEGILKPVPIRYNTWHDVELIVRGAEYTTFFDGQQLFHGIAQFDSGWVGLGSAECVTRFKKIMVTNLKGDPIWEGLPDDLPTR